MKNIFRVVAIVVGVFVPTMLSAQEDRHVEVTTTYTPEVAAADKLLAPAVIEDNPSIETEIAYGIDPETWQIKLESHMINPTKSSFWDFRRAKRFYSQLGVGYPLGSRATLHYATQNVRLGYLGCGVDHIGNFAQRSLYDGVYQRSMADSYDVRNRVYLGGGVFAGRQMFEAGVEYKYDIFNSYAVAVAEPDNQHFHDVGLRLRYGDDFVNLTRINFAVEAHAGFWGYLIPDTSGAISKEYSAGGSVRLARRFGKNRVDIDAGYDMWESIGGDYRDMRFAINVGYARKFDFVAVDASLGYMYDRVRLRDKSSHFFTPHLKVLFDTGLAAITPYVELRTSVAENTISNLYKENPYLDYTSSLATLSAMANTRSYDLVLGFSGSAASSRLEYHLFLGANFMRDQVLWYVNTPGLFSLSAGDNNRLFLGLEFGYRPVGGLFIGGKLYMQDDNLHSKYVANDAHIKVNLKIEYQIKRWKFHLSGDYTGKREWSGAIDSSGVAPIAFVANPSVDLRAGISVRASKSVEIYVDGYNLLNDDIFDYAYYHRNDIGFMAGVKVDF